MEKNHAIIISTCMQNSRVFETNFKICTVFEKLYFSVLIISHELVIKKSNGERENYKFVWDDFF